jgi:hypothetical protein
LLGVACARWRPARPYEVPSAQDPAATFKTAMDVAMEEHYVVVARDDAARAIRLEAKVSGGARDRMSFIDMRVVGNEVQLGAVGYLVRADGSIHKTLDHELDALRKHLEHRLAGPMIQARPPNMEMPASAPPEPAAGHVPEAWTEPAYDPGVWGNGDFTCIPVQIPQSHQGALWIRLSNGEKADLQLSLAYAPELCRSPAQCTMAGGCPALGIGDADHVGKIAARLSKGEVGAKATLLDAGRPVAQIDLTRHGSIKQAMADQKHK